MCPLRGSSHWPSICISATHAEDPDEVLGSFSQSVQSWLVTGIDGELADIRAIFLCLPNEMEVYKTGSRHLAHWLSHHLEHPHPIWKSPGSSLKLTSDPAPS